MAVRRTISRRIDVLLLKSPTGTHNLATGTTWGVGILTAIRAVVCSAGIKWIWRKKSKQCVWPAGEAAVKRQPGEAPAPGVCHCAVAVTVAGGRREQTRRGT